MPPAAPTSPRSADVIVAGAGHNGLVTAAYLAKAGLDVLVVEASPTIGGMTATNEFLPEAPGHMINEGSIQASLFRTTTIDRDLGLSSKYGLRQTVIDPAHVQMQLDHASLALWRDPHRTADELRRFSHKDAANYLKLFEIIEAAVSMGLPAMQTNPVHPDPKTVLKVLGRSARNAGKLGEVVRWASMSQAEAVEEWFESDILKAALMIGLPFMQYQADGSGWALIYLGILSRYGVAMFHGGTGAFPKALAQCIQDHGGSIRTSAEVAELVVRGSRVTGVRLENGEELVARRGVVTAFSPKQTLNQLLPDGVLDHKLANRVAHIPTRSRGFADAKVNIALKGKLRMTKHEKWRGDGLDLRLGANSFHTYQETLDAQAASIRGEVPEHVPGLAQITTAFDPSMAPEGHETFWFWTGLTPSDPKVGWEQARKEIEAAILRDSEHYYEGLEELEIGRRTLCLPEIEERFHAVDGSVYHVDPIITRFGPTKPALGFGGYETPVPGLFLTGSGTHPVAGISGMPGQNAARTMLKVFAKEDKKGRTPHVEQARAGEAAASTPALAGSRP
ncbi:MAG TPA: NAD(P)/FAD-dependent oxidoreductase [Baekduia sp.]|nr:NAD(P)/FAD-dependent oxidoreductase [Baekduia sp.]